ncbi:MAG TPA: efflux RND transporter periplasmic adaptor subunit [Tepidisphaeraceae bacterium]|nr:efflux RND transporter periplasmic adaptor subunit [Tepidisphaeraceae bacterium]
MSTPEPSQRDHHLGDSNGAAREGGTALVDRPHVEPSHVPVNPAPETGRRLVIGLVILAVVLVVGFLFRHHANAAAEEDLTSQTSQAADAPAPVNVVRVSTSSPVHALILPGEARAWNESAIYARVSGYLGSWHADIGDKVKKGESLALIDTPELDDQLKAAEAKVAADRSEVVVGQANEGFAESTYNRWKDSQKGVVSDQEREQKKADYLAAVARLKAAESQVELDQSEVNRLTDLTNFKKVVAPYDGVITARRTDIGDLVTAGSNSGNTLLYEIAQADKIRVYVDVPQAASIDVKDGTKAQVLAGEYPGRIFDGTVARNSQAIDPIAKTLRVEVDVDNPDLTLKPGMYLEVRFSTTESTPPLQIPASALSFRSGGPEVAVVGADGRVQFHPVTIAHDLGTTVEIESGLSSGDLVALNISNQIANGDKVQPTIQESPAEAPKPPHVADAAHRG